MINPQDRINYVEQLSVDHKLVAHTADIMDDSIKVGERKSFVLDIADELVASEMVNLQFPCVALSMIEGKVTIKSDQQRLRYQNKLSFLSRWSVNSDEDPSIPASKKAALELTYSVMMDFITRIQCDYEDMGGCGQFRFIDENSFSWEPIELEGSNMCGYVLLFNDEEPANFSIDNTKWN